MRFTVDGEEWEFRNEYRIPKKGDSFLSEVSGVTVNHATLDFGRDRYARERAIVHLVKRQHEFGGVRFMETGKRTVKRNEWYLTGEMPIFYNAYQPTVSAHVILEPVCDCHQSE